MELEWDVLAADEDVYRRMWEDVHEDDDWFNFNYVARDDAGNAWWDSSNEHNSNTTFLTDPRPSPSNDPFSSEFPPSHRLGRPFGQPSNLRREYRPASPRPLGNSSSNHSTNDINTHHRAQPPYRRIRSQSEDARRRSLAVDHSEDWLDREATRRQAPLGHIPDDLFGNLDVDSQAFDTPSSSYGDGIDIDDILGDELTAAEGEADMPTTRPTRVQPNRNNIVDLTDSPPSSAPLPTPHRPGPRKRSTASSSTGPAPKKRRTDDPEPSTPADEKDPTIEHLDLTTEEALLQTQQAQLLATQQTSSDSVPLKIGKRTCIICMEAYTNATVTACGHMYCHECLTQALIAGEKNSEKGVGNCPVCRKPVRRNKGNAMIAVAFMKRGAFRGKARRDLGVLG